MKIYDSSKNYEYVAAMSTIGSHVKPNFCIAVNPDDGRSGDCYFKYYNRESYSRADKVARIDVKTPSKVYHKNFDGKQEWYLTSKDKKALNNYLKEECDEWSNVTNWQSVLYHWNREMHLLDGPFPRDRYSSKIEAFLDGYYDSKSNLTNPSYLASNLIQPDYTEIEY